MIRIMVVNNLDRKTNNDLEFVRSLLDWCRDRHWRMVLYGGYGLDAYFGKMSRSHGDIDVVVYGQASRREATRQLKSRIRSLRPNVTIRQSENLFQQELDAKGPGFYLNLYYVQTASNPFISLQLVVKSDGETVTNDSIAFPPPEKGELEGMTLEVQNQHAHLQDILQKGGRDNPKYVNDLKLLSTLPSPNI